nr:arginine deiminase family protein [Octadecabacter antarcticus]
MLNTAIYKFHPKFAGKTTIHYGDRTLDHGLATLESGDIMPVGDGTVLVGMVERSSPQGVGQLAEALFETGAAQRFWPLPFPNRGRRCIWIRSLRFAAAMWLRPSRR